MHRNMHYLPFWKLRVRSSGLVMENFGDLLRVTNQPLVIQPDHRQQELSFWVPAFKLRPSTFLRIGGNMTLSQEKIGVVEEELKKKMHPVTLPRKEAVQALKSVLAEVALNKRNLLPRLPEIKFHPLDSHLYYLPFFDKGHDLVQEQTGFSLAKSVLHFGRKL